MQDLLGFTKRIEVRLAADEERNLSDRQRHSRRDQARKEQQAVFTKKADEIMGAVITPRMERLVSYFENASISLADSNGVHCIYRFETRPRFPASITLGFSVSHDADIENCTVAYSLQILPVFLEYDSKDSVSFPLDTVDETQLAGWVEQRLLSFLDTYFQLEHIEQYQKQNLVSDPVCGVQVNKAFAPAEALHGSQSFFFCSEDCRARFVSEPGRYAPSGKREHGHFLGTEGRCHEQGRA